MNLHLARSYVYSTLTPPRCVTGRPRCLSASTKSFESGHGVFRPTGRRLGGRAAGRNPSFRVARNPENATLPNRVTRLTTHFPRLSGMLFPQAARALVGRVALLARAS